jgi:hypothetical protein
VTLDNFTLIPVVEITNPKSNKITKVNYHWVTIDDKVLFYQGAKRKAFTMAHPQCNANPEIASAIAKKLFSDQDVKVIQIPVAYLDHNCNDY